MFEELVESWMSSQNGDFSLVNCHIYRNVYLTNIRNTNKFVYVEPSFPHMPAKRFNTFCLMFCVALGFELFAGSTKAFFAEVFSSRRREELFQPHSRIFGCWGNYLPLERFPHVSMKWQKWRYNVCSQFHRKRINKPTWGLCIMESTEKYFTYSRWK